MLKRLIAKGFSATEPAPDAPVFASEQILIFRATATIAKPTRFDDFYEFVLGGPDAFPAQVEPSEPVMLKHGAVFPINPGQLHMAVESRPVREYLPIFIAKDFVSELTYQAWGKEQVHFSNRNHPVQKVPAVWYVSL